MYSSTHSEVFYVQGSQKDQQPGKNIDREIVMLKVKWMPAWSSGEIYTSWYSSSIMDRLISPQQMTRTPFCAVELCSLTVAVKTEHTFGMRPILIEHIYAHVIRPQQSNEG